MQIYFLFLFIFYFFFFGGGGGGVTTKLDYSFGHLGVSFKVNVQNVNICGECLHFKSFVLIRLFCLG